MANDKLDDKHLLALLMMVEKYQKEGKSHIEALQQAAQRLEAQNQGNSDIITKIKAATDLLTSSLTKAVSVAVQQSVKASMNASGQTAADAMQEAFKPILKQMDDAAKQAKIAQTKLADSSKSFKLRHALFTGLTGLGAIGLIALAYWGSTAWQRHDIDQLTEQKEQLTAEVKELQDTAKQWAKKAGRANMTECGDKKRLCVEVDTTAGSFSSIADKNETYYILKGY